ncbi:hypothetical protein PHSY_003316 [Pseudozyma hubeiensis SY62]|uniref:Uncharacterized protein n=1 Tax=Pseudozyma hubeiensis (strain SY62) TaxID=1305764 RepID=R9PCE0_PSEHS|nr:hypothetical protein PHSY_003316 [Pseudozyma hubeiensis SY62]GAC95740.1 hypothetical protein PHSY_003316 [Pseudozyma hubeiensis SY62]
MRLQCGVPQRSFLSVRKCTEQLPDEAYIDRSFPLVVSPSSLPSIIVLRTFCSILSVVLTPDVLNFSAVFTMRYHDISKTNYGGPFNYKAFFKVPMDDVDFFLAGLFDFRFKHNYHRLLTETYSDVNSIGTYVVDFTINDWRDSDFVREVSQLKFSYDALSTTFARPTVSFPRSNKVASVIFGKMEGACLEALLSAVAAHHSVNAYIARMRAFRIESARYLR